MVDRCLLRGGLEPAVHDWLCRLPVGEPVSAGDGARLGAAVHIYSHTQQAQSRAVAVRAGYFRRRIGLCRDAIISTGTRLKSSREGYIPQHKMGQTRTLRCHWRRGMRPPSGGPGALCGRRRRWDGGRSPSHSRARSACASATTHNAWRKKSQRMNPSKLRARETMERSKRVVYIRDLVMSGCERPVREHRGFSRGGIRLTRKKRGPGASRGSYKRDASL